MLIYIIFFNRSLDRHNILAKINAAFLCFGISLQTEVFLEKIFFTEFETLEFETCR